LLLYAGQTPGPALLPPSASGFAGEDSPGDDRICFTLSENPAQGKVRTAPERLQFAFGSAFR